ncbi:hypothetical protein Lesp02_62970 [Lentzea sp. NBRC 105346]|nr:hypothetical protein Lesp02_62970 [Lentzea sp. NBRC 105346]
MRTVGLQVVDSAAPAEPVARVVIMPADRAVARHSDLSFVLKWNPQVGLSATAYVGGLTMSGLGGLFDVGGLLGLRLWHAQRRRELCVRG